MIQMLILAAYLSFGGYCGVKVFNDSTEEDIGCIYYKIGMTVGILLWPLAMLWAWYDDYIQSKKDDEEA